MNVNSTDRRICGCWLTQQCVIGSKMNGDEPFHFTFTGRFRGINKRDVCAPLMAVRDSLLKLFHQRCEDIPFGGSLCRNIRQVGGPTGNHSTLIRRSEDYVATKDRHRIKILWSQNRQVIGFGHFRHTAGRDKYSFQYR